MIHYDKCPVCASSAIQRVLTAKDHTVSGKSFDIWQCAHCSLRFTQDAPSIEEIGDYYRSENYISHTETSKGIINSLYLRVRKYTLRSKRRFVERETGLSKGTILDIGAGTGAYLHHMRQAGWDTEGLEPDAQAINRAAANYSLTLRPSSDLFLLPASKFDAITMWHVLEHVHALHEYIIRIKQLLKQGGTLFIAVPNYTSYDAEKYREFWAAYDVPRHLYHFSPAAMQELARIHDLTILKYQPMWFDSFYVSMLSEKYRGNILGPANAVLAGMRSNGKAFSKNRKASSLIYVLRAAQVPA
jgi:2-polyprenyl-3-methyl-5-hydroxy-6-metoxy-1,4-benzoquinol methylase